MLLSEFWTTFPCLDFHLTFYKTFVHWPFWASHIWVRWRADPVFVIRNRGRLTITINEKLQITVTLLKLLVLFKGNFSVILPSIYIMYILQIMGVKIIIIIIKQLADVHIDHSRVNSSQQCGNTKLNDPVQNNPQLRIGPCQNRTLRQWRCRYINIISCMPSSSLRLFITTTRIYVEY